MNNKNDHLKNAEIHTEQNAGLINSVNHNTQLYSSIKAEKPLDRVKEQTQRKRSRNRDER